MQKLLTTLVVALILPAVAGGGAGAAATAAPTGTAVVALDFEPPCLNVVLAGCNVASAHWSAGLALAGAYRVRPDSSYEPMLVERVDVVREPFALTYQIRPDAVWSDGVAVSADDFLFTLETILDPQNTVSRTGYELVTEAAKLGPKTVRLQFRRGYAHWRSLFEYVLPKHVLSGRDFDEVWQDEIADPATHVPIGSGPFLVTGWARGDSLTVSRNPRWWGSRGPILDAIEFRFVPDANTQFNGIRSGELDVILPQPQLQLADLRTTPGIEVQPSPGATLEHLDFNLGSTTMPLLRERWFREAVVRAIDRDAIADQAWSTLAPGYLAQHNLSVLSTQPEYAATFARYSHDPAAVAGIMLSHGCALGADGIWSCGGVRASLKLATTTGNAIRAQAQQSMQEQARTAGIELVPDNSSAAVLFGTRLPAGQYELAMFAWVLSDEFGPEVRYGCAASSNHLGYCSAAVTDLLERAGTEVDPARRAELLNAADALLAEDVPTVPLFLRPVFLARRTELTGPRVNPTGSAAWNAEEWHLGPADTLAPTTTAVATPGPNVHGWNRDPVTVELVADDGDGSGVHALSYSLTGAQAGGASTPGNHATVTIDADGVTTLTYSARDRFGNIESTRTLTIRIDRTAPEVSCSVDPARLWPPTRKLVPVQVSVDVADILSGGDGFTLVSVAGGEPGDVTGFDVGTPDTAGSVRAALDRGSLERLYTLTYEGADRAGNTARCAAVVAVRRTG